MILASARSECCLIERFSKRKKFNHDDAPLCESRQHYDSTGPALVVIRHRDSAANDGGSVVAVILSDTS